MGTIRLILALSVIAAHAGAFYHFTLVGGTLAVRFFYIISGFYMSLILNEKYIGKDSKKLFYTNRLLRLYPIYLAVLLLTFLVGLLISSDGPLQAYQTYFSNHFTMGISAWITLVGTNLLLFGQDIIMFLGIDPATGALFFTENYKHTVPQLHQFLLVPQAWTISLELMFYLLAPFLLRKKTSIVVSIIVISLVLRFYIYHFLGLNQDPWTYRFFPLEIVLFLIGNLSYRLYSKIKNKNILSGLDNSFLITPITMVLIILVYQWIDVEYKDAIYIAIFAILLPLIFISTNKNKLDRLAGELSYPVYICHILVIATLLTLPYHDHMGLLTAFVSIVFAYILNVFIANPIEKIRQKRVFDYRQKNA